MASGTLQTHAANELLERDAELAALAELAHRAGSGSGGIVLVEGAAGIGKTRLLTAVEQLASAEPVRVLAARGGELERSFPFGIAAQLFGRTIAALDGEQRESVLSGAAALALALVAPHAGADTRAGNLREALHARLHGLYWLCVGLAAQQPLVLLVDDAHWADQPSLQWLLFLARRLEDLPITLVLTARLSGAGDWPKPLELLRNEADVSLLRPQPLSEQAAGILVECLLKAEADEAFSIACYRATGGNPFLLSELIAAVRADGIAPTAAAASQISSLAPEGITRSVVVRLGRMSHQAQAVARGVAVLGSEAELRHAAALAGLDLAVASAAADALAAAELLDVGRPLRFVHPVVRSALYAELGEGERARLHRQAAGLLADEGGDLDAIAGQLLASEPAAERWTIEVLLSAAERALDRGSPQAAAAYLHRALGEPPGGEQRAEVLRRLGVVETLLGDPAAAEHIQQAMKVSREPGQRAELALELSFGLVVAGRFGEAVTVLERAIEQIEEQDRELRWRLQAHAVSWARVDPTHAHVARRHLASIPRDVPGNTPGERAILAELAFAALIAGEHVDVVADLATRAVAGGRLLDEQPAGSLLAQNALWALVLCERHEFALAAYDRLIAQSAREGWPLVFALISQRRSMLHHLRGALSAAVADASAAIDAGRDFVLSQVAPTLYGSLIGFLLDTGDTDGAAHALALSGVGDEIPNLLPLVAVRRGRGRLRLARGDRQGAVEDLLAAQELLVLSGIHNPAVTHCRSIAALALAELGQREEAKELAADELVAARSFGAPGTLGVSLRAAGVIEGGTAGIDYLREAVAHLARSPARLEHARPH